MNDPTIETLARRLDRVERENQRLKMVGAVVALAVMAAVVLTLVLFNERRQRESIEGTCAALVMTGQVGDFDSCVKSLTVMKKRQMDSQRQ